MAQVKRVKGPAYNTFTRAIRELDKYQGKVGWFESAKYPGGPSVALVAAVNEFGWPEHNIPPRLGMRATAQALRGEWKAIAYAANKKVLRGEMSAKDAMELLGLAASGDIRKHIADVTQPPLKADTVRARLRRKNIGAGRTKAIPITVAKPLVDTGRLLNSLTNIVEVK